MGLDIYVYTNATPCTEAEAEQLAAAPYKGDLAEELDLDIPWPGAFPRRCADMTAVAYRGECRRVIGMSYSSYNGWREGLAALVGVELTPDPLPERIDAAMAKALGIEQRLGLVAFWNEIESMEEAGEEPATPLWQLLHFSDCEGSLGPSVCKVLADGFDRFAEQAATHRDDWWRKVYDALRMAFREAADTNGWVRFS